MHQFVHAVARYMALFGGFILICLVIMTCVSITGRELNAFGHAPFMKDYLSPIASLFQSFGPIVGDFELVEAGVALAVMSFLPWCQLNRAHAIVELFTSALPPFINRLLAFIWEVLFAFILVIIAWRLIVGTSDKLRFNETTFMLQFPVWWGYAACSIAAVIACLVALYSVWQHAGDLRSTNANEGQAS